MKSILRNLFLLSTLIFLSLSLLGQSNEGFNYQAVARDNAGNPLVNQDVSVRIGILQGSESGTLVWQEVHDVPTNAYGLFYFQIGSSAKTDGTAATFGDIDWGSDSYWLKVEFDPGTGSYSLMGTSLMVTVPYAMHSKSVGSLKSLDVTGAAGHNTEEALFEVKRNDGQTVFAVYPEGVRVYVDENATNQKGSKGGFAVGGFDSSKGLTNDYMWITPDSARIYVDESAAKGSKGGFAVGGFDAAKGTVKDFVHMTPENYFIGHSSGDKITTGLFNATLGYETGFNLTGGHRNVFMGYQSGYNATTGNYNLFFGNTAGYSFTTGWGNIIMGDAAGYQLSNDATQNVIIGDLAGVSATGGSQNVFLGANSGSQNTTGSSNVFLGTSAGYYNSEGNNNVYMGSNAGLNNETSINNTFIGFQAGRGTFGASGSENVFIGVESGYSLTSGHDNIGIGNQAGYATTDGLFNVYIGTNAGASNQSGDYNTMIGYLSGEKTTANWNTMLGYLAGQDNSTGGSQVMVGYQAGMQNDGGFNTMVGSLAGGQSVGGDFNTYIGLAAGEQSTGDYNVFMGRWAGRYEPGSYKYIVESNYSGTDYANNALLYGDFNNDFLTLNGKFTSRTAATGWVGSFFGTGGTSSTYGLRVQAGSTTATGTNYMIDFYDGDGTWEGAITLTNGTLSLFNTSDRKLKSNIIDSKTNASNLLQKLRVVEYNYTKSPDANHTGYIAQEVQEVIPEAVLYNKRDDVYSVSYSQLVPYLHKAIQEQQSTIEEMKQIIEDQQIQIDELKNKIR